VARDLRVRPLRSRESELALAYLERRPRLNLVLLDMVLRLARSPRRGEPKPEVLAAWRGSELAGLAGLQPSVVLDASAERRTLEAFFPHLNGIGSGLVKSTEEVVGPLWEWLQARGRRALLDRREVAFSLEPPGTRLVEARGGVRVRSATPADLEFLVEAARESLREESRPDPSGQDPLGFRHWVRSRIPRAVVAEQAGAPHFVGYADVRCARGWLLQGVFTSPSQRRQGLAAVGVSELCRRAFAAGSDHVQLAVVEGNTAAERLYEHLGFQRFARLRTLLFA